MFNLVRKCEMQHELTGNRQLHNDMEIILGRWSDKDI